MSESTQQNAKVRAQGIQNIYIAIFYSEIYKFKEDIREKLI